MEANNIELITRMVIQAINQNEKKTNGFMVPDVYKRQGLYPVSANVPLGGQTGATPVSYTHLLMYSVITWLLIR